MYPSPIKDDICMTFSATMQEPEEPLLYGSELQSKEARQESVLSFGLVLNAQRMTAHSSISIQLDTQAHTAIIGKIATGKSR